MSHSNKLWGEYQAKQRERFTTVSDHYSFRGDGVRLRDLLEVLPVLALSQVAEASKEFGQVLVPAAYGLAEAGTR